MNMQEMIYKISIHVLRVEDDFKPAKLQSPAHISIHVLRVEDDGNRPRENFDGYGISIHVLRVEDDDAYNDLAEDFHNFNPRPPCGGRPKFESYLNQNTTFQSTSSVWRTTYGNIYSCGMRSISIHVLRVEDDF